MRRPKCLVWRRKKRNLFRTPTWLRLNPQPIALLVIYYSNTAFSDKLWIEYITIPAISNQSSRYLDLVGKIWRSGNMMPLLKKNNHQTGRPTAYKPRLSKLAAASRRKRVLRSNMEWGVEGKKPTSHQGNKGFRTLHTSTGTSFWMNIIKAYYYIYIYVLYVCVYVISEYIFKYKHIYIYNICK